MDLPPSILDPISTCQLALEFKWSVRELGERMSLYEAAVLWPAYFAWRRRAEERESEKQAALQDMQRGRRR